MNQLDLKDRVAIVTGGARGIGYAVAERVLQSGGAVSIWDRDRERLEEAATTLSTLGDVAVSSIELTSDDAVQSALRATVARFGKVDILVNNAGITGGNGPTWELTPDIWRRVIEVNLIAPFLLCRAVVPLMLNARR